MGLKVPDRLGDTAPPKECCPPPKISVKLSPQKMYNFKIIQPPENQGRVIH